MIQTGYVMVEIEYDGDYCGMCPMLNQNDGKTKPKFSCRQYETQNGHPRILNSAKVDLANPKGYVPPKILDPDWEALRCPQCKERCPSHGVNRIPKRGTVLYPTAKQIYMGEWLPVSRIHDLAGVPELKGMDVSASYRLQEDDDFAELMAFIEFRKGKKVFSCGFAHELRFPKEIAPKAREHIMRWSGEMQSDVIDAADTVMEAWFYRDHPDE